MWQLHIIGKYSQTTEICFTANHERMVPLFYWPFLKYYSNTVDFDLNLSNAQNH